MGGIASSRMKRHFLGHDRILECLRVVGPPHGFLNTQQTFILLGVGHANLPLHRLHHVLQLVNDLNTVTHDQLSFWPQETINLRNYSHQIAPVLTNQCKVGQSRKDTDPKAYRQQQKKVTFRWEWEIRKIAHLVLSLENRWSAWRRS